MRSTKILACLLTATIVCSPAWAQEDQERPARGMRQRQMTRLAPEKAEAAWQWQAKELAHAMKLETEKQEKLVKAYVASRQKMEEVLKERRDARQAGEGQEGRREPPGDRRAAFGANSELVEEARAALWFKLDALLSPEQSKEAITSLGSFNRQWDVMVDTILGFEFEEEKTYKALTPLRTYVVEFASLRESGDRQAMREGMRAARTKLTESLGEVLSEEEMEKFEQANRARRGRRQRDPDTN